jgi:class 3 adenylate cyclase/tetratricopeptide (TPR) repeat protein
MNICPNCAAENPVGSRFCGNCGASLSQICASCGAANDPGMRFCTQCGTALEAEAEAAAPVAPAAERRLVSVLFADLVGFTAVSEARDPEETRELLSRYFDTCRRLIGLYGGTVEKFIGDAVMAVWGTPVATEDDAERAVRAGLDLVAAVSALGDEVGAPGLSARAGVLTGEAAVNVGAEGQGMVAGDLVNTASRIQSVAEPGSVFVGDATRRASEQTVAYEAAGEHELKGKQELVSLWRAQRIVSARRGELKSDGLEAPFVGREREVRQLKELFHACSEERKAHLVSITGIAGIGKSRLAWEFYKYFDGIAETVYWHRGRCLAYGEGVTYWALADMVRMRCQIAEDDEPSVALDKLRATLSEHLLDEEERRFVEPALAQLLGAGEGEDAADRQELFAAWRLFFERLSDTYPTVLVFEDLQWADASLLDFVEYLLEWSRSHTLYVVTLARPELLEKRQTWGAGQRSFTSIYLEPLAEPAMEELLAGLVPGMPEPLRAQILARAEGVPLYAVETVRMLLDRGLLAQEGSTYRVVGEVEDLEVPETLHALIAARLDGLSEDERRLLQDGAVLGKSFSRSALAGLARLDEADLAPLLASLVRKEVLSLQADARSPEHGNYGFLQDLVRRVAYETLSRHDRKGRHLAVADHLAGSPSEEEVAEVIASHLLAAYEAVPDANDADELKGRAAAALVRAGERASSLAAAAEAQRYFEQAEGLVADERARADLAARAGEMAWRANRQEEARARLERAHAAYEQLGDPVAAARVASRLADVDFIDGHPPQAVARLEPALAALEAAGAQSDIAAVSAQLGRYLFFSGNHDRVLPYLERALTLAEALDQPETIAEALNSKAGFFLVHGHRPRESTVLLEGARRIALEHDLHWAALRAYNNLNADLWVMGKFRAAIANAEQALELARRVGDRQWEATFLAGPAGMWMMLGGWDKALALAAEAEALPPNEFVRGLVLQLAPIHLHRGDLERARSLLAENESAASSENASWAAVYRLGEAQLHVAEGRRDEASAAIERALALRMTAAGSQALIRFVALDVMGDLAGEEKLRELLDVVDELNPGEQGSFLRAQKARFRARLPEHDAETELAAAERLFVEAEMPFYVAVTQLERAEALLGRDRIEDARPLLDQARERFEELGARPWLERVDRAGAGAEVPA